MYFFSKPILALGLIGSLGSASSVLSPSSLTTSVISGTSIAPVATNRPALNTTKIVRRLEYKNAIPIPEHDADDHCVGHSKNSSVLSHQHHRAMDLVPVSWTCPNPRICREGKKYLSPKVHEAVQNVFVDMAQDDGSPLTIRVTITNNGTDPITFWKDLSPISEYALDLGYFHFQSETDGVVFGKRVLRDAHGYRPDCYSDLIELEAGQSLSRMIMLPNDPRTPESKAWRKMLDLAGDVTVTMSGNWYGIWPGTMEEVMATDMSWSRGFDFWNDLVIPWEAGFPAKSQKLSLGAGPAMGLDLN